MAHIRPARIEEVSAIAAAHARAHFEAYRPLFGAKTRVLEVADLEQRWRHALADGDVALLATAADLIFGVGHARGHRIEALYLLAAYRRQGIGGSLLARILALMHRRGVTDAEFDVLAVNVDAIAFYRIRGARETGRNTRSGPDGDYDDVAFSLRTAPLEC